MVAIRQREASKPSCSPGYREKHDKSVAQVILRWDLQHGIITIPKSVTKSRIIENTQVFDFELSAREMGVIDQLNEDERTGPDPDNFDF